MRFHLIALMERYVLGRLSDDPFVQKLCSDFNVARDLWSGTFDAMLNHFAIIPSSNATFVAAEVPRLRALVDSLLDEKYTCEQAGETLSNLIKVNSVVLGGTEFDFGELTEKLKREVEQYKLFIISEQDRKYAESLAPPASD